MKPMKLTDVGTGNELAKYISDPNWVMQQKMDGARMLIVYRDGELLFTNDGVNTIGFSAAKLRLPALEEELRPRLVTLGIREAIFDGELIIETGVYHVFDMPYLELESGFFTINPQAPWATRHLRLQLLGIQGELVKLSPTAATTSEKRALWQSVVEAGVEGAVSKHIDSKYIPGIRTKEWVKHKLVKTADVVVAKVERLFDDKGMVTHGSAALVVPIKPQQDPEPWVDAKGRRAAKGDGRRFTHLSPRRYLPIGNASLIGKELTIEAGTVVEINYLYWTGKATVQPRIVRQRWDKADWECDLEQFPEYTRKVAWKAEN